MKIILTLIICVLSTFAIAQDADSIKIIQIIKTAKEEYKTPELMILGKSYLKESDTNWFYHVVTNKSPCDTSDLRNTLLCPVTVGGPNPPAPKVPPEPGPCSMGLCPPTVGSLGTFDPSEQKSIEQVLIDLRGTGQLLGSE